MTPEVVYCFEDQNIQEATGLRQQKPVRRLPVLNREKRLTGIVSRGDLALQPGAEGVAGATLQSG